MYELQKSILRRLHDTRFVSRYFVGHGIDIGAGTDPLNKYQSFFPLIKSVKPWDLPDGDAQYLKGEKDCNYDFVHSSHCLEHMIDVNIAFENWLRVCKINGHMILVIPDEDLYEQGIFPSTFNSDHKWTFTINKKQSWCERSINVLNLLNEFKTSIKILKVELLDATYINNIQRIDQTYHSFADSAIEIILQKIK